MTNSQILWGLNSFLFVVCFFFVKIWINTLGKSLDKMEVSLAKKIDLITCNERHGATKKTCDDMTRHKHAPVAENGTGGEVILP